MKLRKLYRKTRKILGLEVGKATRLGLATFREQVKIRPRIRLFTKFIIISFIILASSSKAIAVLKQNEAKVKINGHRILVAAETDSKPDSGQIDQAVVKVHSPFELKKPVDGYVSQGYSFYHRANDIAAPYGSPIHPIGTGVVEFAGRVYDGKGNIVIVDHGDGLKSLYAHMDRIEVGVGNLVSTESTIGTIGLTGHTTGPHVHLEVLDNDTAVDPGDLITN